MPHRIPAGCRRQRDAVADHLVIAPGREPRPDEQTVRAEHPHELCFAAGAGAGDPQLGLQLVAVGLGRVDQLALVLALGAVALPVAGGPRAALGLPALDLPQPVALLKLTAVFLGPRPVVVHLRGVPGLADELHHHMDVVVAARRRAMPQREPPALLLIEPHPLHELLSDRLPLLIRQRRLLRMQRQRAVPDVRVNPLRVPQPRR